MHRIFLIILLLGTSILWAPRCSFAEYDYNPSTPETPDPKAVAIKPALIQLNKLVVIEVEKGLAALQAKDVNTAVQSFIMAINIAPYEPMAYTLLIKTMLASGQEDLAYMWTERSGRNMSDSNVIINSLYNSATEQLPSNDQQEKSKVYIAPFKDNKLCAISFMFDDGEPSVDTDILPMFEQAGYRATVAINPGFTAEGSGNTSRGNWNAWRKALAHGHEIANHGTNHRALPGLTPEELQVEVGDSFKTIQSKLGVPPLTFVFPEDKSTPQLVDYVENLHVVARDHESLAHIYNKIFIPVYGGKRFSIPTARLLIDLAIMRRLWLIPQCHGLYDPNIKKTFKAISPELLKDQLDYLKSNDDKIWVGRFIDVYKYLTERKEITLTIDRLDNHEADLTIKSNLDPKIFNFPLTVVINTSPSHPAKTKAYITSDKKAVPVKIKDSQLLLEIPPASSTVHVQWQ